MAKGSPLTSLFIFFIVSLLLLLSTAIAAQRQTHHFEGFDGEEDDDEFLLRGEDDERSAASGKRTPPPPTISLSSSDPIADSNPKSDPDRKITTAAKPTLPPSSSAFDFWDEDEFEGIPPQQLPPTSTESDVPAAESDPKLDESTETIAIEVEVGILKKLRKYSVEIACVSFLITFAVNYFAGKRENENIALAWASKFAVKDSIFDKNFSLLGVGESDDSPLLLKEGQTVFKFYASGRRYCSGMVATMELKSRQDLLSRLYNMVVPCKDEITFEVYMNDDAMDHVVFALARKKTAKTMHKEASDLQRFAGLVGSGPSGRKWVAEELMVVAESKEIAADLITEAVLDQVFEKKAFDKYGKGFISMHFSDQQVGSNKKVLVFKFALPHSNHMADMSRLVALVPYYIDLIGRYKPSPHARSKTEAARAKVAQELHRELQNARQEAQQRKKAEQRKKMEESESKMSAEALRKKEAKERARQMKKAMPKIKMSRGG